MLLNLKLFKEHFVKRLQYSRNHSFLVAVNCRLLSKKLFHRLSIIHSRYVKCTFLSSALQMFPKIGPRAIQYKVYYKYKTREEICTKGCQKMSCKCIVMWIPQIKEQKCNTLKPEPVVFFYGFQCVSFYFNLYRNLWSCLLQCINLSDKKYKAWSTS